MLLDVIVVLGCTCSHTAVVPCFNIMSSPRAVFTYIIQKFCVRHVYNNTN